ncbi:hypothetical protein [Alicyclobacillus sp. ALC3]|uniref:hypothetical protein n=1 Tax=Alicyclobacillus sp. ALC3 TaxID=2796143 RepID=UPI002377E3C9|nr:hypothetical protein [Alicyclobacillus sp. ALC3]WDL95145.1 hypothetical protein JC200_11985 [Alicyclobacillus sp. ALC3]
MTPDTDALVTSIEKGCASWRRGDDYEGLGYFQQGCLVWLDKLDVDASEGDGSLSTDTLFALVQGLEKVLDCLANRDTIYATDVLEYEVLPVLQAQRWSNHG